MSILIREKVPWIIISVISVLLILEYFVPLPFIKKEMSVWNIIIINFAAYVGAISVLLFYGKKFTRMMGEPKKHDKLYAAIVILSFFGMILLALVYGPTSDVYTTAYTNILAPLGASVVASIFVYSLIGAYRALRITSLETLVFFSCALIYAFKLVPVMTALFPPMAWMGEWVMIYIGGPAIRVGIMAAALASLVVGIRTILWREKSAIA